MTFTTGNKNIILLVNPINKSVFMGNAARPIAGLVELERFGLSNPLIRGSFDAFQKFNNFPEHFLVVNGPIAKVIKSIVIKIERSHFDTSISVVKSSKSFSDSETTSFFFSRFLIALFTRLTYSSRLSFLFSPKSETGEIEISSSSSLLKRAFILFKKSGVSSLERIRITVSIIFNLQTKIYNSMENFPTMKSEGFTWSEALAKSN